MKKLVAGAVLGVMLLGGFSFAQNSKDDLVYGELEPTIFSVGQPTVSM